MHKIVPKKAIVIPGNAKRVFSGQIFDAYQWDQEMFDGSSATFEMLRRPDTILIAAVRGDKILVVEDEQPNRKPLVGMPGGRADPSDISWEDAAKRELLEETGARFTSWRLIDVKQPVRKIEWFVAVYLATDFESQEKQSLDVGEKIEVREVEFEEFRDILMQENANLAQKLSSLEDLTSYPEFDGIELDR